VAIVEVDEVVEPGEIPAERIGLPGIFVSRVVRKTVASSLPKYGPAHNVPRTYNGKPAWTRRQMAELAASLLPEGSYVNLGLGIPSYLSPAAATEAAGRFLQDHTPRFPYGRSLTR
jgi:3-oxoacid CoA-transferase